MRPQQFCRSASQVRGWANETVSQQMNGRDKSSVLSGAEDEGLNAGLGEKSSA